MPSSHPPHADQSAGSPPALSPTQMQAARQAATAARRRRSEVKTVLKEGRQTLRWALEVAETDDVVAHIKVVDLLRSMPRVGDKKALRLMERLEIAPNRRIRGLGSNQVQALLREFE